MLLPTLRQMQFLVALQDHLHFGRAAETCHVTQSTLSNGLKDLETLLGAPVAERTKRSVMMTPLGAEIADRARMILRDAGDIMDLARQQGAGLSGPVRLGTIPTIGPYLLPRAVPVLRDRFPDLQLYLREGLTDALITDLRAGRLDAILIALPFELGDLTVMPLFKDSYQLATGPDHPLARRDRVTGADLVDAPMLLLERGHCLQRHAMSAFPGTNALADDRFAASSLTTLTAMVAEGLGITLMPQLAIDAGAGAAQPGLSLVPVDGACPRQVVLAWRKSSVRGAALHDLGTALADTRATLTAA